MTLIKHCTSIRAGSQLGLALIAGLLITLTGCATTPIAAEDAAAAHKLFAFQTPADTSIQVTRDAGFYGAACTAIVYIDGVKAAAIDPGQTAQFNVPAGPHIVGVAISVGLCNAGLREIQVETKPSREVRLRISLGGSGDLNLAPTAF